MKFQINLLRLTAIAAGLVALAYFLMPQQMAGLFGIQLTQPSAFGDVRAIYGGLGIGTALFLWQCATPTHARMGVRLLLLSFGGLLFSRSLSIVIDGPPNVAALVLLSLEVVMTIVSTLALRSPTETAQLQAT